MDINQLREYIIQPSLKPLGLWSEDAESLLLSTVSQESLGGRYVKQTNGPALGVYQMEPYCHDILWRNKLSRPDKNTLVRNMFELFGFHKRPNAEDMVWHLGYATFMARVNYLFINYPLPAHDDLKAQWEYYKRWWNTELGAATEEQFLKNVRKYKGLKK